MLKYCTQTSNRSTRDNLPYISSLQCFYINSSCWTNSRKRVPGYPFQYPSGTRVFKIPESPSTSHHTAAFKGCVKYQEVSQALKVSVQSKVSYPEALTRVSSSVGVSQHTGGAAKGDGQGEIRQPLMTSTPLPTSASNTVSRPFSAACQLYSKFLHFGHN